jgi:hypothetical protein
VGEAIVRDFGRFLAPRDPRRTLAGVSQGAFFVRREERGAILAAAAADYRSARR